MFARICCTAVEARKSFYVAKIATELLNYFCLKHSTLFIITFWQQSLKSACSLFLFLPSKTSHKLMFDYIFGNPHSRSLIYTKFWTVHWGKNQIVLDCNIQFSLLFDNSEKRATENSPSSCSSRVLVNIESLPNFNNVQNQVWRSPFTWFVAWPYRGVKRAALKFHFSVSSN